MYESKSEFFIRKGRPEDAEAIHRLIVELAIYERAEDEVTTTVEDLIEDGFGSRSIYRLFVAEVRGEVVGMALWYEKYSTWKGRCGFLEDLVVRDSHRGKGIGKALFLAVARACTAANYGRMEWQVLDWNEPAISFYKSLGSELDPEWLNGKLTRKGLSELETGR
ncbi:MAG: GNAT family N-acetyltransferase [Flavobacteriales bacterium]|jgi:GNAT superfamily N-acetyltransferase|nr:GNAT family N-acetyltransferase [Flavobacteriales bacterium]